MYKLDRNWPKSSVKDEGELLADNWVKTAMARVKRGFIVRIWFFVLYGWAYKTGYDYLYKRKSLLIIV